MKTIGIVGGIAPASTIEYYKYLIDAYRQSSPGGAYPSIVINSIDPRRMLGMMEAGDMSGTVEYLVSALRVLADAGVALALFASNTPHLLFDDIRSQSPVPLISIVEAAREEAQRRGLHRVGLLGTGFTMRASFYRDAFAPAGITLVAPDPADIDLIHDKYMTELVPGVYRLSFELGSERFFEAVTVDVRIEEASRSYHILLLVAPYGLSSYRGS